MSKDFDNRVAIVTGGASGIGLAAVRLFARRGAAVIIADISEEAGKAAESAVRDEGGEVTFVRTDVGDQPSVAAMLAATVKTYGRLDCALNNAGVSTRPKPFAEHTAEEWNRVMAINLTGVFFCMQAEIRQFLEQGQGGAIVVTSSLSGLRGKIGDPAYSASKAGVRGLVREAAGEFARQEIRVNTVLPTITETPMYKKWVTTVPERAKKTLDASARGRAATTEEVAQAAVWLCSDDASFVSGVEIATDAGGRYFQPGPAAED